MTCPGWAGPSGHLRIASQPPVPGLEEAAAERCVELHRETGALRAREVGPELGRGDGPAVGVYERRRFRGQGLVGATVSGLLRCSALVGWNAIRRSRIGTCRAMPSTARERLQPLAYAILKRSEGLDPTARAFVHPDGRPIAPPELRTHSRARSAPVSRWSSTQRSAAASSRPGTGRLIAMRRCPDGTRPSRTRHQEVVE